MALDGPFGDFVFHERLREVTELIHEQNQAVDAGGEPYVTIAYLGELYVPDPDNPSLAGVQGELLGLAYEQYVPHLVREFMSAFTDGEGGGRVWEGAKEEYEDGVPLYQTGNPDADASFSAHLDRLCTEGPPDLVYFAGRSEDLEAFRTEIQGTGGDACVNGDVTIPRR
ncbi:MULTISPECIES: hypothetical protein [unclassified Nocardiopsis]|uniref:hypothetical protein n=1 Tax=unclassified Nocardiopsis TaxID=2649073 RepID=UPI00135CD31B|nr:MULTISPECIES: hypothetical protein [unclassified Nocardiopsis]